MCSYPFEELPNSSHPYVTLVTCMQLKVNKNTTGSYLDSYAVICYGKLMVKRSWN